MDFSELKVPVGHVLLLHEHDREGQKLILIESEREGAEKPSPSRNEEGASRLLEF